jgi:hypothetical protein
MKQIDQEPRDYRAKPVKGEPIFQPGGLRRLGLWVLGLAISLAISIPLYLFFYPIADVLVDWMLGRL